MKIDLPTLERCAINAAMTLKSEIRQQLFSIFPQETFKLYPTRKMAEAYKTAVELEGNISEIAGTVGIGVDEFLAIEGTDTSVGSWDYHISQLLSARQFEAPADKLKWATAIVKLADYRDKQSKQTKGPNLKTGRDLREMNIQIEFILEALIPKNSVVLLYGRGGIGKTTNIMQIANAIDRGEPIFGLATVKTQVIVIDFENSLAVLSERAKRTAVDGVLFWDSGQNPPSLDKADWTAYQALLVQYPGAVFVFDTLRSSHSGDENSSEVMTLIMRRMRQLRDAGATVILLHHTPKGNDRQFKGSGAIFDLCDQTLALYQTAKPGSDQEAEDDDDDPEKVYRFGTGKKTRYKPHRIFLSFDTEQEVFVMAKNPDDEALEYLHSIISRIDTSTSAKQGEIVKQAMEDGGHDFGGEKKIRSLLKKGMDRFWTTDRGLHNSIIYRPIQFGSLATPYIAAKLPNRNNPSNEFGNTQEKQQETYTEQMPTVTEFGSFEGSVQQLAKQADFDEITIWGRS